MFNDPKRNDCNQRGHHNNEVGLCNYHFFEFGRLSVGCLKTRSVIGRLFINKCEQNSNFELQFWTIYLMQLLKTTSSRKVSLRGDVAWIGPMSFTKTAVAVAGIPRKNWAFTLKKGNTCLSFQKTSKLVNHLSSKRWFTAVFLSSFNLIVWTN